MKSLNINLHNIIKNNSFGIIVIVFVIIFLSIVFHFPGVNGPSYWRWAWQDGDFFWYFYLLLAGIPFFISQYIYNKNGNKGAALFLLMLSSLLLQLTYTSIQADGEIYKRLSDIILSPSATSYFTAAESIDSIDGFFANFSESLNTFPLHAKNKPFGLILFYYGIQSIFSNPSDAAFYASIIIIVCSQITIYLIYRIVKEVFENTYANHAWNAASYYAILPAFIVMTPEFDQVYPVLASLLILYWNRVLKNSKLKDLLIFTFIVLLITFITWNILIIGLFLVLFIFWAVKAYHIEKPVLQVTKYASFVFFSILGFYIVFNQATGYNLIEVFQACIHNQEALLADIYRPWKYTMFFDIYDFFLGSAYLNGLFLLLLFFNYKEFKEYLYLVIIVVVLLLFVAVTHLLPGETARVWLFMQPLSVIVSVIYLQKFSKNQVQMLFVFEMLILIAISQNMVFILA